MVEPDRMQVKIRYGAENMPDTWRITKARIQILTVNIFTIRTYCFSTETMVTRTRFKVTLYVHCLYCYT